MLSYNRPILALLAVLLQPNFAYSRSYVVKKGDTLSQIAHRELGGPVWGTQGSLNKVMKFNRNIKNVDRIYVNQKILLSDETEEALNSEVPPSPQPELEASSPEGDKSVDQDQLAEGGESGESHFSWSIDGVLSSTAISVESKDRSFRTKLHSKTNQGLSLQGFYAFDEASAIGLQLRLLRSEFADTDDNRFQGSTKILKKFELSYQRKLAESWRVKISGGSEQAYFMAQRSQNMFQLDPVFVDFLGLAVAYDILSTESIRWSTQVSAEHNRPAHGNYAVPERGVSYGAASTLSYRLDVGSFLQSELFYDRRNQDTSLADQWNREIGLMLGLRFDY